MNQKSLPTALIGAIFLFAAGVLNVVFIYNNYSSMNAMECIYYLGTVAIGVGLLINNYLVSIISSAICALLKVYWVFHEIKFELWRSVVYELSYFIAFVLLIVLMLPYLSDSMSKDVHKLWFLPGVILAVGYLPVLSYSISYSIKYSYNNLTESFSFKFEFVVEILFIAGVFFIGHGICNQPAASGGLVGQTSQVSPAQALVSSPMQATALSPSVSGVQESFSSDNFGKLRKYKELLDAGIFTQEEFEEKKKELLG